MRDWLYNKVKLVPDISDEQIARMRHIEPVLMVNNRTYRRIRGIGKVHPRNQSFLWDAEPTGVEFTFDVLNRATAITQHRSSIFFKPSLAEVYAWMLVFFPDNWHLFDYFCLGEPKRLTGSTDCYCECEFLGGRTLVKGAGIVLHDGSIGHLLVARDVREENEKSNQPEVD